MTSLISKLELLVFLGHLRERDPQTSCYHLMPSSLTWIPSSDKVWLWMVATAYVCLAKHTENQLDCLKSNLLQFLQKHEKQCCLDRTYNVRGFNSNARHLRRILELFYVIHFWLTHDVGSDIIWLFFLHTPIIWWDIDSFVLHGSISHHSQNKWPDREPFSKLQKAWKCPPTNSSTYIEYSNINMHSDFVNIWMNVLAH